MRLEDALAWRQGPAAEAVGFNPHAPVARPPKYLFRFDRWAARDLMGSGTTVVPNGTAVEFRAGAAGRGIYVPGTIATTTYPLVSPALTTVGRGAGGGRESMLVVFESRQTQTYANLFRFADAAGDSFAYAAGGALWLVRNGSLGTVTSGVIPVSADTPHALLTVTDYSTYPSGKVQIWLDGRRVHATTGTSTSDNFFGWNEAQLFHDQFANQALDGVGYAFALWDGYLLSEAEACAVTLNPWSLFDVPDWSGIGRVAPGGLHATAGFLTMLGAGA
jgi:hypothetical protein